MSALENIKNKTEQSVFSLVELLVLARFTLVGILAAAVHISIAWILISISALPPIMANLLAWSVAFMISFAGHYYWTFQARCNRNQALRRFFLISLSAFLVNNVALAGLLQISTLPPQITTVMAACLIPLITYLVGQFWAFRS